MITRMYYTIWSDCIKQIKSVPASKSRWKIYSLTIMSLLMGVNLMFLSTIFQRHILGIYIYHLEINFFSGNTINTILESFILFMLPMMLINYFLIFRKDRYLRFIDKYKFYNGKYFLKYLLASLWIPIFLLLFGMLYIKLFNV